MPINPSVIGAIADNVADLGTDIKADAQAIQVLLDSGKVDWTQVNSFLANIVTYGGRLNNDDPPGEAQKLRDEVANPTG